MSYLLAALFPPYQFFARSSWINLLVSIILCLVFYPLASLHGLIFLFIKNNDFSTDDKKIDFDINNSIKISSLGQFDFEIVGESNYQRNLEEIAGAKTADSKSVIKQAFIIQEPSNPYDEYACMVCVDQLVVGYLPKEYAKKLTRQLKKRGYDELTSIETRALIVGGWRSANGRSEGHFGVKLDLPWPIRLK